MEKLTLQNICGGTLSQQFEALYPDMIAHCKSGEKCSMSITISFERVPDTATMVRTDYTLKTKTPGFSKAALCVMDSDFGLKTDEVEKTPEPVPLFKIEGGQK